MRCNALTFLAVFQCSALAALLGGCLARNAPATAAAAPPSDAELGRIARTDLLNGAGIAAFALQGDLTKVELAPVAVVGQPFTQAVRATVKEPSGHEWAVQLQARTTAAVAAGDTILATFYLRTEKAQQADSTTNRGETAFVFELASPPYSKSTQYPVLSEPTWIKVQVRFRAARDYRPGEAQIIFRLGYEPQIIELGGVHVENFGQPVPMSALPNSEVADRARASLMEAAAYAAEKAAAAAPVVAGGVMEFTIDASRTLGPISPYIYGLNAQRAADSGATVRRLGGNRHTTYNWEINASNAGSDYHHNSDEWACTVLGIRDCATPAAQVTEFARTNRQAAAETVATIPLVDYVVADKAGRVPESDRAPSRRWMRSLPEKPGPYVTTPALLDGVVYQDELVNLLVTQLGPAARGGIKFYSLDNEPALWPETHPRVHPERTRYDEVARRTEAISARIVRIDPTAFILGGVTYGWKELLSLQDAPDAAARDALHGHYVDFLLSTFRKLEETHRRRVVHGLDVHWYPEARGTKRITEKDVSPRTVAARLQAPRSLWDPTYLEKSWIASTWGKPIRLIPWLHERIAANYPGTALAITEYNFGAPQHISGALAQVDVLGIFGREGVTLANYWGDGAGVGTLPPYIKAAFQLYRNYDGQGGSFGEDLVAITGGDVSRLSAYAAVNPKGNRGALTIIVINKEQHTQFDGVIALASPSLSAKRQSPPCTHAKVYRIDNSATVVQHLTDVAVTADGQISAPLPPLSATLFVCAPATAPLPPGK